MSVFEWQPDKKKRAFSAANPLRRDVSVSALTGARLPTNDSLNDPAMAIATDTDALIAGTS
jgi:hypothetical protein